MGTTCDTGEYAEEIEARGGIQRQVEGIWRRQSEQLMGCKKCISSFIKGGWRERHGFHMMLLLLRLWRGRLTLDGQVELVRYGHGDAALGRKIARRAR